jgi:Ser-tRNA(Ala) deacylase AlaX
MATDLLFLKGMQLLTCEATVLSVGEQDGAMRVLLDRTLFHPQGGGQPSDCGAIESEAGRFVVTAARLIDGDVHHTGNFESGHFAAGDTVRLTLDAERRQLMSAIHSAGHLVDMAVQSLGLDWIPGKGFHFPDGPYVEYRGEMAGMEQAELVRALETGCQRAIDDDLETRVLFLSPAELPAYCPVVPDWVPKEGAVRIVLFGSFAVPCGGTHVARLSQIGRISIRKIKGGRGTVRVSYSTEERLSRG